MLHKRHLLLQLQVFGLQLRVDELQLLVFLLELEHVAFEVLDVVLLPASDAGGRFPILQAPRDRIGRYLRNFLYCSGLSS